MSFRKSQGNMYIFVSHTWNVIKGKCSHDCTYCYMKRFPQGNLRFDRKELDRDLGEGNFIFVGSSTDMFANDVLDAWIKPIILHCSKFKNRYLFQSKNPERFETFDFPPNTILGTTIESNRIFPNLSNAPEPYKRALALEPMNLNHTMVTIEPILDFDLKAMVNLIETANPTWVNIGADSKGHGLPEPPYEKVLELITELKKFTQVHKKSNLNRLDNKDVRIKGKE